jgi:hypothetical protein
MKQNDCVCLQKRQQQSFNHSIIQASGVDVIKINFAAPSCDVDSIASFFILCSSFFILHFFNLHQLSSIESISSTSSMIITNASLKILVFMLGFHA